MVVTESVESNGARRKASRASRIVRFTASPPGRGARPRPSRTPAPPPGARSRGDRKSTPSELQSRSDLVCRLLLEKKKKRTSTASQYTTERHYAQTLSTP